MEVNRYAGAVKGFYALVYRPEIFKGCFSMLPSRCQAAILLEQIVGEGVKGLDARLDHCAYLSPMIKRITDKLKDFVN